MSEIREKLKHQIGEFIKKRYGISHDPVISAAKDSRFGDYSVTSAFSLAKLLKKNPVEIANEIASHVKETFSREVDDVNVVNGFVNITFSPPFLMEIVSSAATGDYGRCNAGNGLKVNLEFVSANPTGPLNVVNARAAAVGDSLKKIMRFCGYDAWSEYYVNDAGGQIRALRESVKWRMGLRSDLPEDGYGGEYLIPYAQELKNLGITKDEDIEREIVEMILSDQMKTLERFRVKFDVITRESFIRKSKYPKILEEKLREKGLIYEKDGAVYFKATSLGGIDEKDRVLVRSNGEPTYFYFDLAYHIYKFDRGFEKVVDFWGPDHHGYIPRMKAGLKALDLDDERFDVKIIQQVNIIREGKKVRMSKRKGELYTLKELLDEVNVDAARFFFLLRSYSSHLDFDIDLAKEISVKNPVYYVQYAHARISSIFKKAAAKGVSDNNADLGLLTTPEERLIMRELLFFPDVLEEISAKLEPHLLTYYLTGLAEKFHNYYQKHTVADPANRELSAARLRFVKAIANVIKTGLELIGVSAPEEM